MLRERGVPPPLSATKEELHLLSDKHAACPAANGAMPDCAPLAVPYVPFQTSAKQRYDQNESLANGTLFPGLDLPFYLKTKAGKLPSTPLAELQAIEFVLVELGLYLDTHKDDAEAFAVYQQYAELERAYREKYEQKYGPLTACNAAWEKSWECWVQDPWPWNYQEGGK